MSDTPERIPWIDALRGLAIILMVPANLAPYLAEPHAMWFRILGSFAAPTFIMLSAGMVVLTAERHDLSYYLKRGGSILLIAMLIDVLMWGIFPWTSFDVLYTIGLALPLMYMLRNVDARELLYISVIIVLATYVLQRVFGYHAETLEVYFSEMFVPTPGRLLQSWFIDGWFPLFPWMGYAILGAMFFRSLFAGDGVASTRFFLASAVLTALGFLLLFLPLDESIVRNIANGSILETRGGYSEIFYPPTFAYVFTSLGIVTLSASVLRRHGAPWYLGVLGFFGRYSMLVYILHQAMGTFILAPMIEARGMEAMDSGLWFTIANVAVLAGIAAICLGIELLKKQRRPQGVFLQVLIGR